MTMVENWVGMHLGQIRPHIATCLTPHDLPCRLRRLHPPTLTSCPSPPLHACPGLHRGVLFEALLEACRTAEGTTDNRIALCFGVDVGEIDGCSGPERLTLRDSGGRSVGSYDGANDVTSDTYIMGPASRQGLKP